MRHRSFEKALALRGFSLVEPVESPHVHPLVEYLTSGEDADQGTRKTLQEIFADMTAAEIREIMRQCEQRLSASERRIGFAPAAKRTTAVQDDQDAIELVRRGMESPRLPTLCCNLWRRR